MIPAKAVIAQVLLDRAFERSIALHRPVKPWVWADMAPVARLAVPRLGLERIVLDSGSGQALAFGPTVVAGGATAGRNDALIIAAHRDTHFRFLGHLRTGDLVELTGIDNDRSRWRVTGAQIVRNDRFAISEEGRRRLLLTTCYPFGATSHGPLRFVVYAERI
jgi:sortase A